MNEWEYESLNAQHNWVLKQLHCDFGFYFYLGISREPYTYSLLTSLGQQILLYVQYIRIAYGVLKLI